MSTTPHEPTLEELLADIEAGADDARRAAVQLGWVEPWELEVGDRFWRWNATWQVIARPTRNGDYLQTLAKAGLAPAWSVTVRRCHRLGPTLDPQDRVFNIIPGRPVELAAVAVRFA